MSLNNTRPTVVKTRPLDLRGTSSTRDLALVHLDLADDLLLDRQADVDAGVDAELLLGEGGEHFVDVGEDLALAGLAGLAEVAARRRQVVAAHDDVLRRADDGLAVGRAEDVVGGHHQHGRLDLRLDRQRQMHGHLIAVEVGVEALAHQRMDADGVALDQRRLERLDAHAVQRRRPVEQHRMVLDDLFEDVPDLLFLAFEHLLGRLDGVGVAQFLEAADDERLEQLQGDLLGQTALVQLQFRPDDDDGAGRVIDALAQQVLAEAALLALNHVGQRLQRPIAGAEHRPLAAVVVEQGIDRLLQHPLLVADDDLGGVEIDQLLEAVVAVDNATIEVVQIAGGEVAAVQQHERPQVRRDDRDALQDHPFRLVLRAAQAAVAQRLDHLEALDQVALFLLGRLVLLVLVVELLPQLGGQIDEVESFEQLLDGLGAHVGLEAVAVALAGLAEVLFGQQLSGLQRRIADIGDDVILEVDDLLQAGRLHVQQRAQARRHGLEEPDVDDRRGQLDVAHALAADAAVRDLDAAAVADHALVLHAAVLAAGALPVLLRPEDAFAEQAVLFGTVGAVVDRLRLLDFAERPGADVVRAGQADAHRPVVVDAVVVDVAVTHGPPSPNIVVSG